MLGSCTYSQLEQIDKTQVKIMSKKPTYEEIEQRTKELENESVKRKQAEKAVRESEDNIRTVLESTADGILAVDVQGKVRYSNRIFAEMWHIPRELLETGKDDQLLNHVFNQLTDPEVFVSKVEGLYGSSEEDFDVLYFKDGRIFERFSRPLKRNGMVEGRVWSFRDVTERKRSDEALRKSQETYRLAMDATTDGLWDWDVPSGEVSYSPSWLKILGGSDVAPEYASWENRIHPKDKESVRSTIQDHIEGKTDFWQKEHRLRSKTGEWKWALGRGRVVDRGVNGQPLRMVGTMTDISERKRAEEALRESEEKYRSMMEAMKDPIYICLPDFRVEYMNPAMIRRTGRDATGEHCFKALHDLEEKCSWCMHDKAQQGECF